MNLMRLWLYVTLLCCSLSICWASTPFVQAATGYTAGGAGSNIVTTGTGGIAFGSDVTSGNYLHVLFQIDTNHAPMGWTISQTAGTATIGTPVLIRTDDLSASITTIYYQYGIPITGSGTLTLQGTYGETFQTVHIAVIELSDIDTTTPFTTGEYAAAANFNVATGATMTTGNTPTLANTESYLCSFGAVRFFNGLPPSAGNGTIQINTLWPEPSSGGTTPGLSYQTRLLSSTTATNSTFTAVANFSITGVLGAVFKKAAAGGGTAVSVFKHHYSQMKH